MLEVRGLTKRFRSSTVVDHVNFTLRPGEITGYLGPNGSGKSTTVKMIVGLLTPSEGQVFFDGQDTREDPIAFKRRLGYVPEDPHVYPYLTGLEYLQLAGRLHGMEDAIADRKANELLAGMSLTAARWAPLSSYSKGMRQRVLIAAALLHDPDLLIFDEAQSGLDTTNAVLFRHLLQALAKRGKTILYISHVLELVERVCSRVIILYKGNVAADDSVAALRDLTKLPNLEEIFAQLVHHENLESRAEDIASLISQ
jgi:ABC-2 type transport system ATP-binding protein